MASSIIFLVVIGIWAAFLLPDLQLRRNHLAESRAANKVLSSVRVLKRGDRMNSMAEPGDGAPATTSADDRHARVPSTAGEQQLPPTRVLPVVTPRPKAAVNARAKTETAPLPKVKAAQPQRRRIRSGRVLQFALAGLLLAALICVPVAVALVLLNRLPVWGVPASLVAVVLALTAMRLRARRRATARRRTVLDAPVTKVLAAIAPSSRDRTEHDGQPEQPSSATTSAKPSAPFDQEAAPPQPVQPHGPTQPATRQPAPQMAQTGRPGAWTPQPVPTPTYLLKPSAPRGPLRAPSLPGQAEPGTDPFDDLLNGDIIDVRDDVVDLREPGTIDLREPRTIDLRDGARQRAV